MKKFYQEFKDFALKGNMVDMAIGVIIGTAFNRVVNVIVKNIITPPLAMMTNQVTFADKKLILKAATADSEEIAIGYGLLIESMIDFLIVALTIFIIVKAMNSFRRKAEDVNNKEVETPKDLQILSNIEKLLETQNKHLIKK